MTVPAGPQGPKGDPGVPTEFGVLRPGDKLLIHLKESVDPGTLHRLDEELTHMGLANEAIIFSGDVVESLVVVHPAPVDTETIVEGSRTIIEEMKTV